MLGHVAIMDTVNKKKRRVSHGEPIPVITGARTFLDSAANATSIVERLTTKLRATLRQDRDASFCKIVVTVPTKFAEDGRVVAKPGVFKAEMSAGDVHNFQRYHAIYMALKCGREQPAHAIALLRNVNTGVCELHDPNGSISSTYPGDFARELATALTRGLLRPLVSPEVTQPLMPYGVFDCGVQDRGIQALEVMHASSALSYLTNPKSRFKSRIPASTFGLVKEYLSEETLGFCALWTLFKIIDNVKTGLGLFTMVENAIRGDGMDYSNEDYYTFWNLAENVWFKRFLAELNLKRCETSKELFQHMMFSIFTRKLATYLMDVSTKGVHLGSTEEWWPVIPRGAKIDSSDFESLLTLIMGESVLDFTKVHSSYFGRDIFNYEHVGWIAYKRFPFDEPEMDGRTHPNKLWTCKIDTSNPIQTTLKLY